MQSQAFAAMTKFRTLLSCSALLLLLAPICRAQGQHEFQVLSFSYGYGTGSPSTPIPPVTLGAFPPSLGTLQQWKVRARGSLGWTMRFQNDASNISNIFVYDVVRLQIPFFYVGGGSEIFSAGSQTPIALFVLGQASGIGCGFYRQTVSAGVGFDEERYYSPGVVYQSGPWSPFAIGNFFPQHFSGPIGWQYCTVAFDVRVDFAMSAIFSPASPWIPDAHHQDLGQQLSSPYYTPRLMSAGPLTGSSRLYLWADGLPPDAPVLLVVGVGQGNTPFLGGTIVPSMQLGALLEGRSSSSGDFSLTVSWPSGPPNTLICCQVWAPHSSGPQGALATNGIGLTSQ